VGATVVTFALVVGFATAVNAWLLMLIAGGLHHAVHDSIPPIGYSAAFLVTLALAFVGGFFRARTRG
jgi:hypothetical protein